MSETPEPEPEPKETLYDKQERLRKAWNASEIAAADAKEAYEEAHQLYEDSDEP